MRIFRAQRAADAVIWALLEARHQERNQGKGPLLPAASLQCPLLMKLQIALIVKEKG